MRPLRIAIDCRVRDPRQGIWTAVQALAHGLASLKNSGQTYTFIVPDNLVELLRPHISGACSVLAVPSQALPSPRRNAVGKLVCNFKFAREIVNTLRATHIRVPKSDGTLEQNKFDLVHFPTQIAYLTNVPSIYQPWDLQHLHYPQFFTRTDILTREKQYRTFSHQAAVIAIQTEWGKQDLIKQYGVDEAKVRVVRWGSVFEAYTAPSQQDIQDTRQELNLPQRFLVFPAVTWPHKNHEVIIRSIARIRTTEQSLHAVFTGATTGYKDHLLRLANELGVLDRIHFVGFVTPKQLSAIFSIAVTMVFPSKFEGLGLPILEAFHAGLPVLSSNATVLPEVVGDAALLFDPDSPDELASLLCRVSESTDLQAQMIKRGRRILSSNTASQTAKHFAGVYDEIARRYRTEATS